MNGRVYDAGLGRFISADPMVQAPGNAQSLNRYSYTINNPLALTDLGGTDLQFEAIFEARRDVASSTAKSEHAVCFFRFSRGTASEVCILVGFENRQARSPVQARLRPPMLRPVTITSPVFFNA